MSSTSYQPSQGPTVRSPQNSSRRANSSMELSPKGSGKDLLRTSTYSSTSPKARSKSPQQTTKLNSTNPRVESSLTQKLKDTIMNDADAAKVMTEDMDHIVALQLSPDVIANYQFKNFAAMRRILEYGSDIAPTEGANAKSPFADLGTDDQVGFQGDMEATGTAKLEPVFSNDAELRRKIREKLEREARGEKEDEMMYDGAGSGEVNATLSPVAERETGEKERERERERDKEKEAKEVKEKDEKAKGARTKVKATAAGNTPAITSTGTKSPFTELFADPERQVKRSTFSPFSSKTVPQLERRAGQGAGAGNGKGGVGGSGKGEKMNEIEALNAMMMEEDEEEDEDGDDLFIEYEEKVGESAAGSGGKADTGAASGSAAQAHAMMLGKKKKKKKIRLGKSLIERTFSKEDGGDGKGSGASAATVSPAKKRQQLVAQAMAQGTSGGASGGVSAAQTQSVQLYKSTIRMQMEDVLMGTVDEEEMGGEGEERGMMMTTSSGMGMDETGGMERERERGFEGEATQTGMGATRESGAASAMSGGTLGQTTTSAMGMTTMSGMGMGQTRVRKHQHPMTVTRVMEPNNPRAVDSVENERDVEDALLQKYVHLGITSPAYSVTEFQRFMVKTQVEAEKEGQVGTRESKQKETQVMKRYNEKQITEMKYTRQIPVSGNFVMEVKKPVAGGSAPSDGGKE
ncbi:uncharacterized protein MONOS_1851 [Monocercomonoides exilis]|uniref:uncharacterized protein n=1 Tax=Monocercomonoides exilis TaxID=2049356 RepID=UPI00355A2B1C|nr:hypothetical protein MONOS_1851 [Monocercomonoides exilis]|eukprot:MONOS_1851.1-p1 / transcript=MONOS_1851.1 / gene=MONOS_1851 / organism=Monocercomonoides_exilis_PA203 / gene_product=unspecified product / transcript_product=unspecified product / location=Mono_scaffold00035:34037-36485(-) / protein_length=689 / sequence_SO=supercontig / SO=protein_coding / is_pseudo=false